MPDKENLEMNPNFSEKAKRDFLLVQSARKGDQKAFAALLNEYRDNIYFMLLRMVNNPSDAEDLTIEAFGKAFKHIGHYTPNFAFSTWLFKIATNNCIDFLRKRKHLKRLVSIDQPAEEQGFDSNSLVAYTPDPEANMISKQKIKKLRDVVASLDDRYRLLVELRYFEELSYAEIAERVGIPIGTVKARLFRSRELLHNILSQSRGS